ncbi:phenylalanine--tRNA ligase subunit alpha [Candidatus Sumerlaeota bacterium]|nr:phenylalanine--tRNA ligase subunit alpha [Candidatus Sumerlaeales bacterium]NLD61852.1 phenylalanine--tRNA ligase subunit alpha [Candidatus Sumerlaeota bacterium]
MEIQELEQQANAASQKACAQIESCADLAAIEALRPELLGKKAPLRAMMKLLGSLDAASRPAAGKIINEAQTVVDAAFEKKLEQLQKEQMEFRLRNERIDVTMPSTPTAAKGALNPLTLTQREMERIFISMGYSIAEGPETETEFNNFDALNLPANHPARDMHDTFYLKDVPGILRTHTSPVQVRYMLQNKPPLAIVAPGRVFRVDDVDATHSPVFNQMEGLFVGKDVTMADLKGTLLQFIRAMFGEDVDLRFRPSFFPFTEPSAEVDMKWHGQWLEVLGCGMVNPIVLRNVNIDPDVYQGFAFGLGIERFAMLRYGVDSIRSFYENDLRFIKQFA